MVGPIALQLTSHICPTKQGHNDDQSPGRQRLRTTSVKSGRLLYVPTGTERKELEIDKHQQLCNPIYLTGGRKQVSDIRSILAT